MSKRKPMKSRTEAIRLFAKGQIDIKEFQAKMKIEETTARNYEVVINRFKKTGKRPKDKAICKEFFIWADEWEKEHDQGHEQIQHKEENRRIRFKVELLIWEYT